MTPRGMLRTLLASASLVAVWACGIGPTAPPDFSDPSLAVRARSGEEFVIRLESNASTGYSWRLARPVDGQVVVLVEAQYEPPTGAMLGSSGVEHWRFRAVSRGQTTIDLEYVRPWDTAAPARTVSFVIFVS